MERSDRSEFSEDGGGASVDPVEKGGSNVQPVSPAMRRFRVGVAACIVVSLCITAASPYLSDGRRVIVALLAAAGFVVAWWQWRHDQRSLVADR